MAAYISRWHFIINRCAGKSVLHLGCVGITEGTTEQKLDAWKKEQVLHPHLREVCKDIVGIDYDETTVMALRDLGYSELLIGDVTKLESIDIERQFDIILCGDLIEHLSNPGLMLKGIKRFMNNDSELLITTPNAFGLLHFIKWVAGCFKEGNDHVLSFQIYTLSNLLRRHGFSINQVHTCYNRPPTRFSDFLKYIVGIPFFKIFPRFGGTLLVIAKLRA
jgi:SAM-dependent methyltransferase